MTHFPVTEEEFRFLWEEHKKDVFGHPRPGKPDPVSVEPVALGGGAYLLYKFEERALLEGRRKTRLAAEGLCIVIGNYGRGEQVLWPETDRPKAYPRAEAEQIVLRLNRQGIARPGGSPHWHAKPLSEAEMYIARGRALDGVRHLRHTLGDESESESRWGALARRVAARHLVA